MKSILAHWFAIVLCLTVIGCSKGVEEKIQVVEGKIQGVEEDTKGLQTNFFKIEQTLNNTVENINSSEQRIKSLEEKIIVQETQLTSIKKQNEKLENKLDKLNEILIAKTQQESKKQVTQEKQQLRQWFSSIKKIIDATELGVSLNDYSKLLLDAKENVDLLANSNHLDDKSKLQLEACWSALEDAKSLWDAYNRTYRVVGGISGMMGADTFRRTVIDISGIDSRQGISDWYMDCVSEGLISSGDVLSVLWRRGSVHFVALQNKINQITK